MMTLASTIDHAISQLQALRKQAEEFDKIQSQTVAARSAVVNLETEVKRSEETKARLLREIESLRQQVEALRGEKLKERDARQEIVSRANAELREINEQITSRQSQRDEISSAISQLKSKFG